MPDLGAPRPPSPARAPHVSTSEWQSFEGRMRQRRAERCVARAERALAEGHEGEALEALEEARRLAPETPDLDTIRARVASDHISDLDVPAVEIAHTDVDALRDFEWEEPPIEVAEPAVVSSERRWGPAAALAALLVMGLGLGTLWFSPATPDNGQVPVSAALPAPPAPSPSSPETEVARPADPVVSSQPAPTAQDPDVASLQPAPRAPDARVTAAGAPPETRRGVPAEGPVRVAFAPPPPTVGTAGGADLPLPASGRTEVPVEAPPPPVVAPPSLPATPLENLAAGTPVSALAEVKPPVAPPPAASTPAPEVAAEPRIRAVLSSYEAAFRSLDAAAVQRIWPGVDQRALARAFDGLNSQSVSLGKCAFAISGTSATAQCTGSATWTPKVGSGSRTVPRRFQFSLQSAGDTWRIVDVEVR